MPSQANPPTTPGKRVYRRPVLAAALAALSLTVLTAALSPATASAHAGGDAGGCALQGAWLHDITRDPATYGALYGVPGARNLGDIASFVAPNGYLAWFIENVEHVVFC